MKVTITTTGIRSLKRKVDKRIEFIRGPALRQLVLEMGADVIEAYNRKVMTFTPGRVRDLRPATKEQKQREVGYIYPILRRTGQMMNSIYTRVKARSWRDPRYVIRLGFKGRHSGGIENSELARIHTLGLGNNPKRDFTALPKALTRRWTARILAALRKGE